MIGFVFCAMILCSCGTSDIEEAIPVENSVVNESVAEETAENETIEETETVDETETIEESADDMETPYKNKMIPTVNGEFSEELKFIDKEDMLETLGFAGEEPFYEYYDEFQRIKAELFWDEDTSIGCGVHYRYPETDDADESIEIASFVFDNVTDMIWENDVYSTLSVHGDTGEIFVTEYKENFEYTEDGKIDYFVSEGMFHWVEDEPEWCTVLEIDFIYREDGTLSQKNYLHNSRMFGTQLCSVNGYYDEQERLIYELCYITYGDIECYYIYTDEDDKPDYCLSLNWMGGECWPAFTRYE